MRKVFFANLVTNAAAGLVFSKETDISLSQYLSSAQHSKSKRSYVLMHYRFFLAVIKQHARRDALGLVEAGKFAELGELIKNIRIFGQKCAESKSPSINSLAERFQAEEIAVITAWFNGIQAPDNYAQSIAALEKVSPSLFKSPQIIDAVASAVQEGSNLSAQLQTAEDYKKVIMPLLELLDKDTETFVTHQVLLLANLDLDKTLQIINAEKSRKDKAELISKLATTVATRNLPSFQLLTRLHPDVKRLFAAPQFAFTIQMVARFATIDKDDVHSPLLQLLKVCLVEKESEVINKTLLLFMTLKKPSSAHYNELVRLLSCDENKSYLQTLENLPQIQIKSFANYQALLREAAKAKTDDVDHKLIGKLFDIAITKAKNAEELLSLASACRNNAVLAERLAKSLYSRFPQIGYLKTLINGSIVLRW